MIKLLWLFCLFFAIAFCIRFFVTRNRLRFFQNLYLFSLLILGAFLFIHGAWSEPVFSLKIILPSFVLAVLIYFLCFKGSFYTKFIFSLFLFFTLYTIGFYFFQSWERVAIIVFLLLFLLVWQSALFRFLSPVFFLASYAYVLIQVCLYALFTWRVAGVPFGFAVLCLYLGFGLSLLAAGIYKKQVLTKFHPLTRIGFAFFHMLFIYYGLLLGVSTNQNDTSILHQKEVVPVLLMSSKRTLIPWQIPRFAMEDCTGRYVLVTLRGRGNKEKLAFIILDQRGNNIQKVVGSVTGDGAYLECPANIFYFTCYETKQVLAFQIPHVAKPIQSYRLPAGDPDFVVVDREEKVVLVAKEMGGLYLFHLNTGELIAELRFSGLPGNERPKKLFPLHFTAHQKKQFFQNKDLYLKEPTMYQRYYYIEKRPAELQAYLAELDYHAKLQRFYLTRPMLGEFSILDANSNRSFDTIFLERIIRYVKVVPKYELVFVSGHATGKLFVLHAVSGKLLTTLHTGPRVHKMTLSQDSDRLYFASNQGVFYIDLPRLAARLSQKKM